VIERRTFLVGLGSIITLPLIRQFEAHIEKTATPLILPPGKPQGTLYVNPNFDLQITHGHPEQRPLVVTWAEFLERRAYDPNGGRKELEDIYEQWGIRKRDFGSPVPKDVLAEWATWDTPDAQAYTLLEEIDLGPPLLGHANECGGISFINAPSPGNGYLGVHCHDLLSVSLLQARLRELGETYEVKMLKGEATP
jgi:hypothetical protein